ncbi:LCP family protein [Roseburia hominis]
MSHTNNKRHHGKKKSALAGRNIVGKLITVLQFLLAVILLGFLWNSGLIPGKYLIAAGVVLIVLSGLTFGLQYVKSKVYIVGIIISVLISLLQVIGIVYLNQASQAVQDIGGANYKTDNMIVVVKEGKPVETLLDMKNYRYGTQTMVDQENTKLMVEEVNKILGRDVHMTEYNTIQELAEALLSGSVEAAIYNEAFTGIIEDAIPDYQSQVKIIYHYGIDTELEVEDVSVEEPFNVYISGIDVSGPITTNSRSDVNIIATVNPETKKILLTTTPRDYYVKIPGVSGEQKDKLTHAGIYGIDTSIATLEQIYDIEIPYYARVNFTSLIKIVDILGGVDVSSDYSFSAGKYQFTEGMNHLDGEKALAFVRERHSFADGDNQRGKNQEKVLTAMIQKAMSPAILTNASSLLSSVSSCLETNMPSNKISELIQMQLNDGASWEIVSVNATGLGDKQACYSSGSQILYVMQPDNTSVDDIKRKMQAVLTSAK